jgi:tetrahydromethanopterin S-methyltransferase subunit B
MVRAVDAVAVRCDELSERVGNLELTADDLARSLGQEIALLRASVERSLGTGPGTSTPQTR